MHRTRIGTAISLVACVLLAASCADKTVGPDAEMIVPFAISDAQRTDLAAALRFAMRDDALSALADHEGAARIAASLADLVRCIDANDRSGTLRRIHAIRSELRSYRDRGGGDAGKVLAVETVSLALDHAEMLAAIAPAALYVEADDFD